jgi:hypothetical protein
VAKKDELVAHYEQIQKGLPVRDSPHYGDFVVPNGNHAVAYHRWFHLKEAFSNKLLEQLIGDLDLDAKDGLRLLDPFAGVGTAPLSALLWGKQHSRVVEVHGVERNPFLQFVASTKLKALTTTGPRDFRPLGRKVARLSLGGAIGPAAAPTLPTFFTTSFFSPGTLSHLLRLKAAISSTDCRRLVRDLAWLCLAAIIEPVSGLRRDGRALRFEPKKTPQDVISEFLRRVDCVATDWTHTKVHAKGDVHLGDGRNPRSAMPASFRPNLILFSPPYPNNIDYTEVYKLEAWFLGFISSRHEFRRQRLATLRSHPSIRFPEEYSANANGHREEFDRLLRPLIRSVPDTDDRPWRVRLVNGYFSDIQQTLENCRRIMTKDGWVVIVVGNSLHGSKDAHFVIASDLLLSRLAELTGYRVEAVQVARYPKRKRVETAFLRESVIFLRRSDSERR